MRTRGLQITSLLVASPVALILLSLIYILLLSICSQLRIWISAIGSSIGFNSQSAPKNALASNSALYYGVSSNQFSSLDSQTIASVDKISVNAPGSGSAWMHRLSQYLRMMPLRFAASSTILLAIIVLICIFAFRIARYKIRGQDAYETCMEKLAEYRIPGTMYINTKKFHEFLKATERPPTVRRWQLSKESTPMSEGSHTSLPTHTQQDHSMLRVHRSGLTRPRSRSNASSNPHFDSPTLPKESQVLIRRADPNVEEKPAAANRSNTLPSSPTLSEHRKHNMLCNEPLPMDRQDAIKPSTSKSGDNASEIKLHHNHSIKVTAEKSSVTKSPLSATLNVNIDKPSSYHQPKPKISDMPESPPAADDSQDVFVQVERKKKKKTKVAPRPKPQLLSSPRSETPIQEAAKPTVDQVVACEPQLDAVPPDAWVSSPSPIVESPKEPETVVHSHKHDTAPVSPEQDQKPEQTSLPTVSSPPACAKMPYQEHTGAWYSPFSTGLQLDILPRSRTPQSQQPVYNHYPAASYSHFNGIAMNYRKHYQQSSLPYISRTSSPLNLIGRERMPDYHTMSSSGTQTFTSSPYYTESHETPYGMERRRWRPYIDPEAGEADLEFSLFDKKLPGN